MTESGNSPLEIAERRRRARRRVFTGLAIAVIVMLAIATVFPCLFGSTDRGMQRVRARFELGAIATAVDDFHTREHRYPQDPSELVDSPSEARKLARLFKDVWGDAIIYRARGAETPEFYSPGPDGIDNGGRGDDVLPERH